jgi:undecaprenyl diphosphate synthase
MGMEPAHQYVDPPSPPTHVAIIMDGNGRWAREHNLARFAGHKRGTETLRGIVIAARELGISYLTVYGFSSENWRRPADEVNELMGLLRHYLRSDLTELHANGIRVRVIGDRQRLHKDIIALVKDSERQTRNNTALHFTLALGYGSRQEIVEAARHIALEAVSGGINPESISEEDFTSRLSTAGMPDPDLVIRTSGEMRLSNFLLWQSAYAELVFTKKLWPDFCKQDLIEAITEFRQRERRYGATGV